MILMSILALLFPPLIPCHCQHWTNVLSHSTHCSLVHIYVAWQPQAVFSLLCSHGFMATVILGVFMASQLVLGLWRSLECLGREKVLVFPKGERLELTSHMLTTPSSIIGYHCDCTRAILKVTSDRLLIETYTYIISAFTMSQNWGTCLIRE
jgi:hypothetical protein